TWRIKPARKAMARPGAARRLWNLGNTDTPGTENIAANTVNAAIGQGSETGKWDVQTRGDQQLTVDQAASTALGFSEDFFASNGIPTPSVTQTGTAGDTNGTGNLIDFFGDKWPVLIGQHLVDSTSVGDETVTGDFLINNPGVGAAPFFHAPA